MIWLPTEYEDLHRVKLLDDTVGSDVRSHMPDTEEYRVQLRETARTWFIDDEVVALIGVMPMWKGVGTLWTLLSEKSKEYGIALTRGSSRYVELLYDEFGYRRLQATTVHGNETAREWVVQLGFSYEGTMVGYGPDGESHDMYARLRV